MDIYEQNPDTPRLSISPSEKSFLSSIRRKYLSDELQKQLFSANVLIIPNEGYGDREELIYFPAGTSDLYQYLAEKKEEITVGVCIEESGYKELSLHADWMVIAEIVVKEFVAPLIVTLLAEYIIHVRGKRFEDTNVKSKLIVVDNEDEHVVEYSYEGPASEYKDVMLKAIESFNEVKYRPSNEFTQHPRGGEKRD